MAHYTNFPNFKTKNLIEAPRGWMWIHYIVENITLYWYESRSHTVIIDKIIPSAFISGIGGRLMTKGDDYGCGLLN